jgi:hypothetical protein
MLPLLSALAQQGLESSLSSLCSQKLQQELEFLEVQEEYIKDEQKNLKKEFLHAQEEVKRIQSIPLVIGQFLEAVDQNTAIVGSTTGEWRGGQEHLSHLSTQHLIPAMYQELETDMCYITAVEIGQFNSGDLQRILSDPKGKIILLRKCLSSAVFLLLSYMYIYIHMYNTCT